MKYCKDCGEIFDEEEAYYEDCGFDTEVWGHNEYQKAWEMKCPYCYSTNYGEVSYCDECDEPFPPDELDDDNLCECCREDKGETNDRITD